MDYKETLHMPKTAFEMRGNLTKKEPGFQKRWQDEKLYEKMLENIDKYITLYLLRAEIRQNVERKQVVKPTGTNRSDETAKVHTKVKKEKIGRNDPCPCGSGKKYKNCCGK